MENFRSKFFAASKTFTTFLLWFLILVVVFTTIGAAQGGQQEGLKKVISFGDPKTFLPLPFSFFFGAGLKFLTRSSSSAFNVARWICSFGRDGYLVFYALIFALVLGTWETSLFWILVLSVVVLIVSIVVMSLIETLEQCISDRGTWIVLGLRFLSAAIPLPAIFL